MARPLKRKGIAVSTNRAPTKRRRKQTAAQNTSSTSQREDPRLPPEYRHGQWPLKRIIEESKQQYLVDWEDHPYTGEEHKVGVGRAATEEWEAEKARKTYRGSYRATPSQRSASRLSLGREVSSSAARRSSSAIASHGKAQLARPKQRRSKRRVISSSPSGTSSSLEIPETQPVVISSDSEVSIVAFCRAKRARRQHRSTTANSQIASLSATQNTWTSRETVEEDSTLGDSLPPDSPVQAEFEHSTAALETAFSEGLNNLELPGSGGIRCDGATRRSQIAPSAVHQLEQNSPACQYNFLIARSDPPHDPDAVPSCPVSYTAQQRRSSSRYSPLFVPNDSEIDLQPITRIHPSRGSRGEAEHPRVLPSAKSCTNSHNSKDVPSRTPPRHPSSIRDSPSDQHSRSPSRGTGSIVTAPCSDSEFHIPLQLKHSVPSSSHPSESVKTPSPSSPPFYTQVPVPEYSSPQLQSPPSSTPPDPEVVSTHPNHQPLISSPSERYSKQSPLPAHPSDSSASLTDICPLSSSPTPPSPSILPSIENNMPDSNRPSSPRSTMPVPSSSTMSSESDVREKLRQLRSKWRQSQGPLSESLETPANASSAASKDLEIRSPQQVSAEEPTWASSTISTPGQDQPIPSLEGPNQATAEGGMSQEDIEPEISAPSPPVATLQISQGNPVALLRDETVDDSLAELDISTVPLLQQNEFVVPLPIDGRIKHQYIAELKGRSNEINEFLDSPKSSHLVETMTEMIRRLNDTVVHTDLGLNGPATQVASTAEERIWTEQAGMKFAFLAQLVTGLRGSEHTVVIVARSGPSLEITKNYLKGKDVNLDLYTGPDGSVQSRAHAPEDLMSYHVISSEATSMKLVPPSSSLIIAMDDSFDSTDLPTWCTSIKLVPVLLLLVVNSAEYVERCVPKELGRSERLRRIVRAVTHVHQDVGTMPSHIDLGQALSLDQGARLALVKKELGAKIKYAADKTVQALNSENFATSFTLPPASELDLGGLQDDPSSTEESMKQVSTHTSRMGTPIGQKRPREESSSTIIQAKRPRLTPLPDMTQVDDSIKSSQLRSRTELKTLLKTTQRGLLEERQKRQKAEESALYAKSRLKEITDSFGQLQYRYEKRTKNVHRLERERKQHLADRESDTQRRNRLEAEHRTLGEQYSQGLAELQQARQRLQSSSIPSAAELESAQSALRTAAAESTSLRTRNQNLQKDFDFVRSTYQEASTRAVEHASRIAELECLIEPLRREASAERRKVKEMNMSEARRADLARIARLESQVDRLKAALEKVEGENKALVRKGRAGGGGGVVTRASSAQPTSAGTGAAAAAGRAQSPRVAAASGGSGNGSGTGSGTGSGGSRHTRPASAAPASTSSSTTTTASSSSRAGNGNGGGSGSAQPVGGRPSALRNEH